MREILGEYPIKISIPHNTQLTWYLIQIPDTRPDPNLKNPTRLTLGAADTNMRGRLCFLLWRDGVYLRKCLNTHGVCGRKGLNTHGVCGRNGLNTHCLCYF